LAAVAKGIPSITSVEVRLAKLLVFTVDYQILLRDIDKLLYPYFAVDKLEFAKWVAP
jgi:hypothetical protein